MKNLVCLVILFLCIFHFGFTQQKKRFGELVRTRDSVFIAYNGTHFRANLNVVTVKFLPEVKEENIIKERNFKVLHTCPLGYINLSVPKGIDIENFVAMLDESGQFESVEYNTIGTFSASSLVPVDTHVNGQWHLNAINAFSAWNITVGSSGVKVAVIDDGVDWTHPDIGFGTDGYRNVDPTIGWNFHLDNNDVKFSSEHGTKVAAVLGAKTHNIRGIAGVSGGYLSSGVTMIPYAIGEADYCNFDLLHLAINNAVSKGARIINLSLNGTAQTNAINSAIANAKQNGVLIVHATGNGKQSDNRASFDWFEYKEN